VYVFDMQYYSPQNARHSIISANSLNFGSDGALLPAWASLYILLMGLNDTGGHKNT
jgi:hypothetical protein